MRDAMSVGHADEGRSEEKDVGTQEGIAQVTTAERDDRWWIGGVIYQIYPWSFADSNGDGLGDLPGIVAHLDYLADLGVDGIWLSPTMPSPKTDWGYDVADYRGVDPALGTEEDLAHLVAEAGARGIRVVLDLVPNHTSDAHPWFVEARSSREARRRDWYVWADPAPDGGPPNNWIDATGRSAWTYDSATGQYYLHNYLPTQPDLNWWNDEVRREFLDILRYWFDRGIAGFRIDVAHGLVKDAELRDNPPVDEADHPILRRRGLRPVYNANRPEVHEIYRDWRKVADSYRPPRLLLGETWVLDVAECASYYGDGRDELDLAFNFPFLFSPPTADALGAVIDETLAALPAGAVPVWTASNHDVVRFPTRWAGGDPLRAKAYMTLLLTLPGTTVLYYGDEIGMTDVPISRDAERDPMAHDTADGRMTRDPARTPMQWADVPGGGFGPPEVTPWLPLGDLKAANVADQVEDPDSMLALTKALIRLRRSRSDLSFGAYHRLSAPSDVLAYRRGADTLVVVSLAGEEREVVLPEGEVLLGTRAAPGASCGGGRALSPYEALVIAALDGDDATWQRRADGVV